MRDYRKPGISVTGVDPNVARVLQPIKDSIEGITGQKSNGELVGLSGTVTTLSVAQKVNELVARVNVSGTDKTKLPVTIDETAILDLNSSLANTLSEVAALRTELLLAAHPVGSYYWSSESTDPGTLFGGTWLQITDKFVYAAGSKTVGATGGEETHTLVTAEVPAHTHTRGTMEITGSFDANTDDGDTGKTGAFYYSGTAFSGANGDSSKESGVVNFAASRSWSGATSSVGGDGAHNNMPPYIVAYCWRRTA